MITGRPASIDNRYMPGSGVGATSISVRRAKAKHADVRCFSDNNTTLNPPKDVEAAFGNSGIIVSWSNNGNSGILSHTVIAKYISSNEEERMITKVVQGSGTSTIFLVKPIETTTDLTIRTVYQFTVFATNGSGNSRESIPSDDFTAYDFANAPTDVEITLLNESVDITFNAQVYTGGDDITDYNVYSKIGSVYDLQDSIWVPLSNKVSVTGLTNGTPYSFVIRPVNAAGEGKMSEVVNGTPRDVPGAPTNLIAIPYNESVDISFNIPGNNGAVITKYAYSINEGITFTDNFTTTSPLTITGLVNGTEYDIIIKAYNAAGYGEYSDMVTTTPFTVPGQPINLTEEIDSQGVNLIISFTEPSINGSEIISYEYALQPSEGEEINSYNSLSGVVTSPIEIGLNLLGTLANGNIIWIRAVNARGAGIAASVTITSIPE
jgi:hypothetical protein